MKTTRAFLDGDRYHFDWVTCSSSKGFAQVDTYQDASYFGTWANPTTRTIICFCEGDLTVQEAETDAEFCEALRAIKTWNTEHGGDGGFKGIDTMCRPEITEAFVALGLQDLLQQQPPKEQP